MTSNTDGAAQGEWHGDDDRLTAPDGVSFHVPHPDDMNLAFYLNDHIIADHRKAQVADVLVKALERIIDDCHQEDDCGYCPGWWIKHAFDCPMPQAVAALAQYHAATEEATR